MHCKFNSLFWIPATTEWIYSKKTEKERKQSSLFEAAIIEFCPIYADILKLLLLVEEVEKKLLWYRQSTKILNNRGKCISWNLRWSWTGNYIWNIPEKQENQRPNECNTGRIFSITLRSYLIFVADAADIVRGEFSCQVEKS